MRDYPLAFLLTILIFVIVIWNGYSVHQLAHALGYIFAVWFGAFVTDVVVGIHPKAAIGFPIKRPVKWELITILVCTTLGLLFLIVRFEGNWNNMKGIVKLSLMPLMLFVFPVVLAIIYLFRYKYKPRELGINLRYWYLPIFIHIVVGCITLWVAPDKSHWKETLKEYGVLDMIFTGLVNAALGEEFLRMLLQTRLGAAFKNIGLGFVMASMIWALMHVPNFGQSHAKEGWVPAFQGAVNIMPIGFLWGYVTYRTQSLIPSIFIHGFNLWGLQNF